MLYRLPWIFAVGLGLLASTGLAASSEAQVADAAVPAAAIEDCNDCHEDYVSAVAAGPHSLFDNHDWHAVEGDVSCSACHGDASLHVDEGGGAGNIFSFEAALPSEASDRCLGCHDQSHPRFKLTPHAEAGLSCVSCHSVHAAQSPGAPPLLQQLGAGAELASLGEGSASCLSCHGEVFTEFEFNERHRLHEGVLECSSCHDPHESSQRWLLAGFKQEQCTDCHADKGGPFVFEHGSSRVDGCVACHSPHGSPNRHLLAFQDTAELCYSCHPSVPQFHLGFSPVAPPRFDLTTNCTNCHSSIHGSNFDPYFLQ